MIKYIVDVIHFMNKYPYEKGDKFFLWIRNCFYLNWQKPWKWNIDAYYLYKRLCRWLKWH